MLRKTKHIVTGIDIGSSTIKVVQIKEERKRLVLSKWSVIDISKQLKGSKLTQLSPKNIAAFVKGELSKAGISIINPAVAISTDDVLFKYFFVPKSVKKRIVALLRLIVSPVPTAELAFGFCKVQRVSRIKKNELVIATLARDNVLDFAYRFHSNIGSVISHSVPGANAMYNLITFNSELKDGAVYFCADIGSENIDLAIAAKTNAQQPVNQLAYFRSVRLKPLENNNSQSDDESLLGEDGNDNQLVNIQDNRDYDAIYDVIYQATIICQRELQLTKLDIAGFLITGERGNDQKLQQYLINKLEKEVTILDPVKGVGLKIQKGKIISSSKKKNKGEETDNKITVDPSAMPTAIGLALGRVKRLPIYIKLESRIIGIEKRKKVNLFYLKVAMFVALIISIVIFYNGFYTRDTYRENADIAKRALTTYVNNESKLLGIRTGQERLGNRLVKLRNISNIDYSERAMLKLLSAEVPSNIVVDDVNILAVGGFQAFDPTRWIRLEGNVKSFGFNRKSMLESIKSYVRNLESVNGIKKVKFREIKERGGISTTFAIEFLVK